MKRRVVRHGSSSLTITLPVKWVTKFGIKKGDEVSIEEAGPTLVVSTEAESSSHRKQVSVTTDGIFTKNNLSHIYQLGYDEVEIQYTDSNTLQEIKDRLPRLMGFEIIDQKNNKVYIKSLAAALESEFDTLLRKVFLITNEMARETINCLETGQFDKLPEVRNLESLNNKFTDVCLRILNKRGYSVANRSMQMYDLTKNLERIADEFKYICDLFSAQKKNVNKKCLAQFRDAIEYYEIFYKMFYRFEPRLKRQIYDQRARLKEVLGKNLRKATGTDSLFLHHIMGIVDRTYDAAGAYFALKL